MAPKRQRKKAGSPGAASGPAGGRWKRQRLEHGQIHTEEVFGAPDKGDDLEMPETEEEPLTFDKGEGADAKLQSASTESAPTEQAKETERNGLDLTLRPIENIYSAIKDMANSSKDLADGEPIHIRVATMCSGTEAPVFAIEMLQEFWERQDPGKKFLEFSHVFSVEISGFKQAYITRNTDNNTILFNDVRDFINPKDGQAPTALGAMKTIPKNIDLLIAGCACVDFSPLNTQKRKDYSNHRTDDQDLLKKVVEKGGYDASIHYTYVLNWLETVLADMSSMGVSGQTFFSLLSYVKQNRPKIVLLENVQGAPWKTNENLWFPFLGYSAGYLKLDTKDYYIPHTRSRVYFIALDNEVFGADGAKSIIREWGGITSTELSRRASAPVNSWLLPPAHPLTERARQDDSERALSSIPDSNWERSNARHTRTRKREGLDGSRPITQWDSTNSQPYDRIDRLTLLVQSKRAKDCIDIIYLHGRHSGITIGAQRFTFDVNFKNRIYDISQNIDRINFRLPFGITGCLTPGGIHWITDQSRLLSGFETLLLQGLPVSQINFATETQEELRDLAGNAMSTTVVGATFVGILSSIRKFHSLREIFQSTKEKADDRPIEPVSTSALQELDAFKTTCSEPFDVPSMVKRCRRYCFCNGSAKYSTDDFLKCKVCSTIRCKWCAGNPCHSFEPTTRPSTFLLLSEVGQMLMRYFPGTVAIHGMVLPGILEQLPLREDHALSKTIVDVPAVMNRLLHTVFYYKSVHVTEVLTICYAATEGFELRAKLSEEGVTWLLYVDAWSNSGTECIETFGVNPICLAQPVAKTIVLHDSLGVPPLPQSWRVWSFKSTPLVVTATPSANGMDINVSGNENIPCSLISGMYYARPQCDAPESSLHVLDKGGAFFFKDVTRTGTPDQDGWAIANECRLMEPHEYREVYVKFDPRMDPRKLVEKSTIQTKLDGHWVSVPIFENIITPNITYSNIEKLEHLSFPIEKCLTVSENEWNILAEGSVAKHKDCDLYSVMKKYDFLADQRGDWVIVDKKDLGHVFEFISHFNAKFSSIGNLGIEFNIADIDTWAKHLAAWRAEPDRRDCPFGQLPRIRWIKLNNVFVAHHHSHAIAAFETHEKEMPPIFQVRVRMNRENQDPDTKQMYVVDVQYLVNPLSLGQKAAAYLPPSHDQNATLTACVKAELNPVVSENIQIASEGNHYFNPFRQSLKMVETGPRFESIDHNLLGGFKATLSPSQTRSLGWMLFRERENQEFTERETEEYLVPELELRLLGCAERKICSRGGVLADDVGYGKTVVTLAMIHYQRHHDQERSVQVREAKVPGAIHLKATLVVVPSHLVDQWAEQAILFLPIAKNEIVKIKRLSDLEDGIDWKLLQQLQNAKLIIVNNAIYSKTEYHNRLAAFAGSLDPPFKGNNLKDIWKDVQTRVFEDWYTDAAAAARRHMNQLFAMIEEDKSLDPEQLDALHQTIKVHREQQCKIQQEYLVNFQDRGEVRAAAPKKDRNPNAEPKNDSPKAVKEYPYATQGFKSRERLTIPFSHLLEAFTFARVVYDEFSYDNFPAMLFVNSSQAYSKWVLSATPPTSNLAAVCGIAKLLNVHIARHAHRRLGMPRITEGPELKNKSNAETLHSRAFISDQVIRERHQKAEDFLQVFAKANPIDQELAGRIEVQEKVVVCELNQYEFSVHLDLQQDLRACGMDASMLPRESRALLLPLLGHEGWNGKGARIGAEGLLARSSRGNGHQDEQPLESLVKEREMLLKNALQFFKVTAEKATWLSVRLKSRREPIYQNAKECVHDIFNLLNHIYQENISRCGGRHTLDLMSKAIFGGKKDEDLTSNFNFSTEKDFFRTLNEFRSTSWSDYYKLTSEDLPHIDEQEATELIRDLERASGPISAALRRDTSIETLKELVKNKEEGSAEDKKADEDAPKPNKTFEDDAKSSKAKNTRPTLQSKCESVGIKCNSTTGVAQLSDLWERHKAGTLEDWEYIGYGNCQVLSQCSFPVLKTARKIRGGTYTLTRSDVSDTSLELMKAFEQVIYAVRQERIAQRILAINKNQEKGTQWKCDSCGTLHAAEDLYFVCRCGHLICDRHLQSTYCGIEGHDGKIDCPSELKSGVIPVAKFRSRHRSLNPGTDDSVAPHRLISSKSQMIANTIKTIPEDEHAILFVQSRKHIEELKFALRENAIGFTDSPVEETDFATLKGLGSMKQARLETECEKRGLSTAGRERELKQRLNEWAKNIPPTVSKKTYQPKVRILKLNDPTSAGTNLQYANHVMFAAPLLVDMQEDYDAFMKQARGRCVRFGQKKSVQVYHFVTANTIEVDILELRRKSHVLVRPGHAIGRLVPAPLQPDLLMMRAGVAAMDDEHAYNSGAASTTNAAGNVDSDGDVRMTDAPEGKGKGVEGTAEERVNSILHRQEVWKATNEHNWLTSVGIEY